MNNKMQMVVPENTQIFTIHSEYQQLSRKDKKRMLRSLIGWSVREWLKNFQCGKGIVYQNNIDVGLSGGMWVNVLICMYI